MAEYPEPPEEIAESLDMGDFSIAMATLGEGDDAVTYSAESHKAADLFKITIHARVINLMCEVDFLTSFPRISCTVLHPEDPAWDHVPEEQTVYLRLKRSEDE
jgi:hypothetical protein